MNNGSSRTMAAAALAAALALGTAAPAGAQQPAPGNAAAGNVSEATVQRTGAAIRDISNIQTRFNQRMQSAPPAEHQLIEAEANKAAEAALSSRGLTVDEYNGVIRLAQADPGLRERLVSAARGAR